MFVVELSRENYEYDVHSIVKAFYAEEQVKVLTPSSKEWENEELRKSAKISIRVEENGAEISVGGQEKRWNFVAHEEETIENVATEDAGTEDGDAEQVVFKTNKAFKDAFKRFLYRTLSQVTGKELPWGNLTGIRPTKIAYGMLEQGMRDEEIISYYQEKHYVSQEKAELSLDIAKREKEVLSKVHYQGGYSLYIGIPFCPTTCLYCSFTSFPIGGYRKMVENYVDCLIKEMEYVSKRFEGKILDSVYIGGGTPTTLEAEQLDKLICRLKELFDFSTVLEFTVEAGRADSITADKLRVLYKHGVTRISVNPQTMNQKTLDCIGRRATVEQVREAYALAREIGFDNINMDLILGLPGELEADVQYTIDEVVKMAPDSLTVHSLAIKRASRLNQWIQENGVAMLHNTDETMRIAAEGAKRLGHVPYYLYRQKNMSGNFENVGYAKEGKLGLYNILIMEEMQTIVALGAGSITKLVLSDGRIERTDNVKDVALYIEKIDEMIERKEKLLQENHFE